MSWDTKEYTIDLVLDTTHEWGLDAQNQYTYVTRPAVTSGGIQIKRTKKYNDGGTSVQLETVTVTEPWVSGIPTEYRAGDSFDDGSEHTVVSTTYDSKGNVTDTTTKRYRGGDFTLK
jgi:hypothetical protein